MKIKSAEFEVSAPSLVACPRLLQPEFAFIGRSNVGKSSLLNMLTERRDLARVSDRPGKTRLMNFFSINRNWRLVDLPGYGYAHGSRTERADFNEAAADYIEGRKNLRGVFALIDSRLAPQQIDLDFVAWLQGTAVPYALIFTKTDKVSAAHVQEAVAAFRQASGAGPDPVPPVFTSSAKTKAGRGEILQYIAQQLAAKRD